MPRPSDPCMDRKLRKEIEEANKKDDCIINNGNGYFRPVPGVKEDEAALDAYLAKELHRARAIQYKRLSMKRTFQKWREYGVLTNNSRETG